MRNLKKWMWFGAGALGGLATLSLALAAAPAGGVSLGGERVTDDTAIYQQLSDIRVAKHGNPDFDQDISLLSNLERRYREDLPRVNREGRLISPMKRISRQRYRPSQSGR